MWLAEKNPPRPERIGWLVWLDVDDERDAQAANLKAFLSPEVRAHFEYVIIIVRHPEEGVWWIDNPGLRDAIAQLHGAGYRVIFMVSRWVRFRLDVRNSRCKEELYSFKDWLDVIAAAQYARQYFGCWGYGLYCEPHAESRYAGLVYYESDQWRDFNLPRNRAGWRVTVAYLKGAIGARQPRLWGWPADSSLRESPALAMAELYTPLTLGTSGALHPDQIPGNLQTLDGSTWHPGQVYGSYVAMNPIPSKRMISPTDVHRIDWSAIRKRFGTTTDLWSGYHYVYTDASETAAVVRAIAEAG